MAAPEGGAGLIGWRRWLFGALALLALRLAVLGGLYSAGADGVRRHHLESTAAMLVAAGVLLVVLCRRRTPAPDRAAAGGTASPPGPWRALAFTLASITAGLLLFGPALQVGLLSDDFGLLEVSRRRDFLPVGWHVRPLPLAIWWALSLLSRRPQLLMHLANLVLHGTNAALVSGLALRLGVPRRNALTAGLFFLAFPASVEAVVWCSGIQDVLMTSATLAFVLVWLDPGPLGRTIPLLVGFLIAGLATKETAAVMPALGFAVSWSGEPARRRRNLVLVAATGAVTVLYAVWRLGLPDAAPMAEVPSVSYALKSLAFRPFAVLAAPWSAELIRRAPWLVALSTAGAAALLTAAFLRWSDSRVSGFGCALRCGVWIPLAAAPTYGFFYVAPDLQGSRYAYLPAVGGAILLATLLSAAAGRGRSALRVFWLLSLIALALAGGALRFHLSAWRGAALTRDRVMAAAAEAPGAAACATVAFLDLPKDWQGAQVFGNGFEASLRSSEPALGSRLVPAERAACRFRYRDGRFVSVLP